MTMPNILAHYSTNLLGASLGDHIISICFGKYKKYFFFNNLAIFLIVND